MATIRAIAAWLNPRRRVVALVLVGWAGLIVVSAGEGPTGGVRIKVPDMGALVIAAIALLVLMRLARMLYLRPEFQAGRSPRNAKTLLAWVVIAVAMVLLATVIDPQEDAAYVATTEEEELVSGQQSPAEQLEESGTEGTETEIGILLLLGAIAGTALTRSRRAASATSVPDHEHEDSLEADLGSIIDEVTGHLRSRTEPRIAVLAAYASLERALAERGQDRDVAETPTEHLARVFATVPDIAGPAVRLGQLYEFARFSDRLITRADRERAFDELNEARRSLASWAGDTT